jgi:hypothetical protein
VKSARQASSCRYTMGISAWPAHDYVARFHTIRSTMRSKQTMRFRAADFRGRVEVFPQAADMHPRE